MTASTATLLTTEQQQKTRNSQGSALRVKTGCYYSFEQHVDISPCSCMCGDLKVGQLPASRTTVSLSL